MPTAFENLLERMTTREDVAHSADSVAWNAYRDAEAIADERMVDDIEAALSDTKSKDEKRACYFILGAIAKNTGSDRCKELLATNAAIEKDKYVITSLLDSLAKNSLPPSLPLNDVYALLQDSRWLVRHAAIQSLAGSRSPESEEHILQLLSRTDDANDKIYCHSTLNKMGSPRAIPYIEANLSSRKRDVKQSAQAALQAIKARHQVE